MNIERLPGGMQVLVGNLLAFMERGGCTDTEFDAMAAQVFAFQYENDATYRRFCQSRGATPRRVTGWRQIPLVPISAFKEATLSCIAPQDCERIFTTSGTTRGDVKGRNHHPTMAVWDVSMQRHFAQRFMRGVRRMRMLTLFPSHEELPQSSLARYLSTALREFGTADSRCCMGRDTGLDVDGARAVLDAAVAAGEPLAVLGASDSFVHLLDALAARGLHDTLAAGSRILDTGGHKGGARAMAADAFYDALSRAFGVAREHCTNMYGMTELSSQYYDDGNARTPSVKSGPHWMRARIVDPLTGSDMPAGERGVIAHVDLANFNSAVAILTEDVGVQAEGGFVLLGRVEGAQARGCSLAVQEFMEASRP